MYELKQILEDHAKWLTDSKRGRKANLRGADLKNTNLYHIDLRYADFRCVNLQNAKLRNANLQCADLRNANLQGADLQGAYLQYTDLQGANLQGANLQNADLSDAKNIPDEVKIRYNDLPAGDLVGWKKCKYNVIVKLLIPADAKRSKSTSNKCRAEYVKVLEVIGALGANEGISIHDSKTVYKEGEVVYPNHWDEQWNNECSNGIHFFLTESEASYFYLT